MDYELLVIGEERDGIEQAISYARDGYRVAVVKSPEPIPQMDVMREAVDNSMGRKRLTMDSWKAEISRLHHSRLLAEKNELESAGVEQICGQARFVSPTTVEIQDKGERRIVSSSQTVLACGTRSWLPVSLQGDNRLIGGVELLLGLKDIPRSTIVVGGGESGLSAAILLATLGVEVSVVDEHVTLLELCGLFEARFDAAQSLDIAFRLDDEVIGTEIRPDLQAAARLSSGRILVADIVLVCVGKEGRTEGLNLEAAGVGVDERGRVWCDAEGQTWAPQISAVGDVIGFPHTAVSRPLQATSAPNWVRKPKVAIRGEFGRRELRDAELVCRQTP